MADQLAHLWAFPPDKTVSAKEYDKHASRFVQQIGEHPLNYWTQQYDGKPLLEALDPSTNTLPYLYTLNAYTRTALGTSDVKSLADEATVFFATFDPVQVRYAGEAFRSLWEWVAEAYRKLHVTDLSPLTAAMLRLDPAGATFTVRHLSLIRLSLSQNVSKQALPILDKDIFAFPQSSSQLGVDLALNEDSDFSNTFIKADSGLSGKPSIDCVLEYYLLGATIYIGLRRYDRARLFLEYILVSPSSEHHQSAYQVEAYKKWVLVGLLAEGRRFRLPKCISSRVALSFRALSAAYDALADDFERCDYRKLDAEVTEGADIWLQDGNLQLVQEIGPALLRQRILDLGATYTALHVHQLAHDLDLAHDYVDQALRELADAGRLNGTITNADTQDRGNAVLRFNNNEARSTVSLNAQHSSFEAQNERIEELIVAIKDADRRTLLSKEYMDAVKRRNRTAAAGDPAEPMDLSWDAPSAGGDGADEDIMGP